MCQRILVPTDGSPICRKTVKSATEHHAAVTGAELVASYAIPSHPKSYFDGGISVSTSDVARIKTLWSEKSQVVVERVKKAAKAGGVKVEGLVGKVLVRGIAIAALSVIAGCGGNGGEDPAIPIVAPTSVSGTAAKGIVRQAKVLVCRIADGVPQTDATCTAGSTGPDGSFSVTLTDGFTGPAVVKVISSETSAMLDETTGSYIRYDMTMRSVLPAIASKSMTYVTPFSEMATSWTRTTGNDAAGITLAVGQVQQLISASGVDLMAKPVIDLQTSGSDPVMLGKQANMVKQLARVTMMAKRSPGVDDSSGGVHCNTPGTSASQQIACAMGAMSGAMTRGANAAAQSVSRIVPAMMAEQPTAVTMAIIRPDGTLDMEVADMSDAASMESAMRKAGMAPSSVANNVRIMMLQMH